MPDARGPGAAISAGRHFGSRRLWAVALAAVLLAVGSLTAADDALAMVQWALPAATVSPAGHNADDGEIADDPQGEAIAIWRESDGANNMRIYASVRSAGQDFGPAQPISPAGKEAGFLPQVAFDRNGNAMAVWILYTGPLNAVVQAAYRPAGGDFQATPDTISETTGASAGPQIAFDGASGNAMAVWAYNPGSGTNEVHAVVWHASTGMWSTHIESASTPGQDALFPRVAFDSASSAIVVWRHAAAGSAYVYATVRPVSQVFSAPVAISAAGDDSALGAMSPELAAGGGDVTAVWSQATGGGSTIEAASHHASGLAFDPVQTLPGSQGGIAPRIAADAGGGAAVVWTTPSDTSASVGVSVRNPDGSFGSPATFTGALPSVAIDPQGHVAIAWQGFDGSNSVIEAADMDAGGSFSSPQTLSEAGQDADGARVALDAIGNPVALWQRSDGSNQRIQATTGAYAPAATRPPPPPGPTGLELSQGVARWDFMPLIAGKPTLLRVYIGNTLAPPGSVSAEVRATRDGRPLEPSPLVVAGRDRIHTPSSLDDPQSTINAVLPESWTHGTIDLDVSLTTANPCNGCFPDGNHFTLQGARFRDTARIIIRPVKIAWDGETGFLSEQTFTVPDSARLQPWDGVARLFPIAPDHVVVDNWRGEMYADDTSACWLILLKLEIWAAIADAGVGGHYVGYMPQESLNSKLVGNKLDCGGMASMPTGTTNFFVVGRGAEPQELAHNFGLKHAGTDHGETYPTEPWPYPHGGIGSYGYNIQPGDGPLFRVVEPGSPPGTHVHDFMSYGPPPTWVSPRTWTRLFNILIKEPGGDGGPPVRVARASAQPLADASARPRYANSIVVAGGLSLGGTHATIEQVLRVRADLSPRVTSSAGALATVVVEGKGGRALRSYPLIAPVSDPPTGEPIPFAVALPLPAKARVTAVVVKRAGRIAGRVADTGHAPTVKLLAPRRGTTLRRSKPVKLRWKVRGARGRVRFDVFYTAGRGRLLPLSLDRSKPALTLAPGTLPAGRVRFQVIATVGLDSAQATSPPLRVRK